MRRTAATIVLVALAIAACGDGETGDTGGTSKTTAGADTISTPEYLAFRAQPTACGAEAPPPAADLRFAAPSDLGLTARVPVTIVTSCGPIDLVLDPELAPETVNSFVFLAEHGYFSGSAVHRAYPGFMVQMGDPTATGGGFPGYRLPDELPEPGFVYTRGTVAMANAGAGTGGSQFFLMLADTPLPPQYTVFGRVEAGYDTLERIVELPMGPNPGDRVPTRPLETVYIERIDVDR